MPETTRSVFDALPKPGAPDRAAVRWHLGAKQKPLEPPRYGRPPERPWYTLTVTAVVKFDDRQFTCQSSFSSPLDQDVAFPDPAPYPAAEKKVAERHLREAIKNVQRELVRKLAALTTTFEDAMKAAAGKGYGRYSAMNEVMRLHGVAPHGTAMELEAKHFDRVHARHVPAPQTPIEVLERRYREHIGGNGGVAVIQKHVDGHWHDSPLRLLDRDLARNMTLLGAAEHVHKGKPGLVLRYLCGRDDNGLWFTRVPATCDTVESAYDWLVPLDVRRALAAGVDVLRQGDLWAVRAKKDGAFPEFAVAKNWRGEKVIDKSRNRHEWDPATRTVTHVRGEWTPRDTKLHGALHVPWPAKFYRNRELPRTSTWGRGRD